MTNPYRSTSDSTYGSIGYTYDALGRVTRMTNPGDGFAKAVTSSYSGNCTTVTDEQSISRQSCMDGLQRRMTSVTENPGGLGYVTSYQYDVLNDLTSVVQNGSRQRAFIYDSLAQLTSSMNPESNTVPSTQVAVPTTYLYDPNGNLTSKTVPAQNQEGTATVTLFYCYDANNRITSKAYTSQSCPMSAPVDSYSYDNSACLGQSTCFNINRRTGMTDPAGTESWAYDDMGRTLVDQRTTNGVTKNTIFTYSPYVNGSLNSITYPSGRVITYTTGAAERPLSAVDSTINYATGAHYVASGALSAVENGGILNSTSIYNNRLQLCWAYTTTSSALATTTTCTASDSTPGNILDLQYTFPWPAVGNNGNATGITNNRDTTRSQSFAYVVLNQDFNRGDDVDIFVESPSLYFGEAYSYDSQPSGSGAWGNLTSISSASTNYTGCTQENLNVAVNGQNQITTYGYDTAGNLTSIPAPAAATYSYNAENQMTQASTPVGVTGYVYDGDGKRVEKVVGGAVTKIYWYGSGSNALDETDGTGSATNSNFYEYIFLGGRRIARRDSSGNALYYFGDHLGTSRSVATILSGQNTATLCYDADFYPFGGERSYVNSCSQNYKFTSKERDSESALDNFGARYYSASMGRFMVPDWTNDPSPVPWADLGNPQSLNLYEYVNNNPLSHLDPNGHGCDPDTSYIDSDGTMHVIGGACHLDFWPLAGAVGHHFVDQSVTKAEGAWNSLAGQFFRRWVTGGPLKNPGVHTGYPTPARLSTQQIKSIIDDVKQTTGRDMSQWTKDDIELAVEEVRNAGGDTGKFLTDIAQENPTVKNAAGEQIFIATRYGGGLEVPEHDASRQAAGAVEADIENVIEDVEEECGGGGCIPPP